MRVKIGDTWFDALDFPIMLSFDAEDITCLDRMLNESHTRFSSGPADLTTEMFQAWVNQAVDEDKRSARNA